MFWNTRIFGRVLTTSSGMGSGVYERTSLRWEPIQALFVPLEKNLDPSSSPVNNYGTAVRVRTGPSSGCMNGRKMGILESRSGPSEESVE